MRSKGSPHVGHSIFDGQAGLVQPSADTPPQLQVVTKHRDLSHSAFYPEGVCVTFPIIPLANLARRDIRNAAMQSQLLALIFIAPLGVYLYQSEVNKVWQATPTH